MVVTEVVITVNWEVRCCVVLQIPANIVAEFRPWWLGRVVATECWFTREATKVPCCFLFYFYLCCRSSTTTPL